MSNWQFNNPKLMSNGDLQVSGPARDDFPQDLIGDVTIRFLIIQQDEGDAKPVIVDHVATWDPPSGMTQFTATVPVTEVLQAETKAGRTLHVGSSVRGIAIAILIRQYDPDPKVPPAIETFTWCVAKTLEQG
jgi:hypothetical protein